MKIFYNYLSIILILITNTSCVKNIKNNDKQEKKVKFALVIHGGAGNIQKKNISNEKEKLYLLKLEEALNIGYNILENNGSSVDAVESVIRVLEDSPLFNAGKGAVLTDNGDVELDAAIMNGKNLNAGGVSNLTHIKNPITLARFVMEKSPHVLLFGNGAENFAEEFGLLKVKNSYFITEEKYNKFNNISKQDNKFGTVGCVALDKVGNLASGTSTGGIMMKKYGRVGDTPIIGAGTYANNKTCALSATGHGEFFITNVVTHDISSLIEYKGLSLEQAADLVINNKLKKQNAFGGVVGIDKNGNIVMTFNTVGMFRGYRIFNEKPIVQIYKN